MSPQHDPRPTSLEGDVTLSALRGKRALVTGAGGFIGSHLVERLVTLGARVRAFVRYNSAGRLGWLEDLPCREECEIVIGDTCDKDRVREAMEGMDVVFHLAAMIAIPYSYEAPASYVRTNIEGTLNVLEAAQHFQVDRVIHTSTSEVYGTARYVPIDEAHPLQGQSPYSATKIGADMLAQSFYLSFKLPVVTVRPFNVFGPRQSSRAVVPTIIVQCMAGDRVKLGSLHPTRDLNYVADTVSGFLLAAVNPNAVGRTINIGSGKEIAIGDLVHTIARLLGKPVTVELDEQRLRPEKSEVQRLCADNTLAKELLGWRSDHTLEDGLLLTIEWMRTHLDRYRPEVYAV